MTSAAAYKEVAFSQLSVSSTSDWANLGGQFRGLPAPIFFGGSLFAFTRNTDNTLGMCKVDASGTKGSWSSWGGTLTYSPAVAQAPNGTLGVIGRAQSGQIQITYVNPFTGVYSPWVGITGAPSGTQFSGPVQLVQNTNARLEAFALDTSGNMWHAWETTVGTNPTWSQWSHLGSGFNPNPSEFEVFLMTGGSNAGCLQAVALGNVPSFYQSTQYAGGGYDSWSQFAVVGQALPPAPTPQFANGPAANFDTNAQVAAYAGYNANAGVGSNPLVYCAPPNFPQWGPINITAAQYPVANAAPVMVSNSGTAQLVWMAAGGQVYLVSESVTQTYFWSNNIQNIGAQNPSFTGQIAGIVNSGNVGLFQLVADGTLAFVNYLPS
jgi:hypothetical protein